MSFIDPHTVIWLGSLMSGLMSLVLYSLKRNYPVSIQGLGHWSTAMLLIFMGTMLGTAQGKLPQLLTISLPRLLIACGLYLTYVGTQRFFNVVPRPKRWIALIALMTLAQLWFTFGSPNFHARLVMATLLAGLLFSLQARLLLKQRPATFACALAAAVMLFMVVAQLTRLLTSFTLPLGQDIFDAAPFNQFYVASFVMGVLLFSIGAVLMSTDRLRGELEQVAHRDSLTNALNRRHMNLLCEQELERSRRHGHPMALLMMDLDHFKSINDRYGHQRGDQVLVNFVSQVNALLRQADQLGRFGGEEFVLLLPETTLEEALSVAERIRSACHRSGQIPACTVSIGITTNRKDSDTLDTLMGRADGAMYRAKAAGRNRVETA